MFFGEVARHFALIVANSLIYASVIVRPDFTPTMVSAVAAAPFMLAVSEYPLRVEALSL